MKNLTRQNPEQLFVAQELINKVKSKCCGIKVSLDEIFPIHKAEEVLQFGKYKGKSLGDIYTTDYQYLYWLETTDRFFKIDFEELEQLYPNIGKPSDISISERMDQRKNLRDFHFMHII